mgnify:CR=1 FL=1
MKKFRRLAALLLAGVLALAVLSGCGGGDGGDVATAPMPGMVIMPPMDVTLTTKPRRLCRKRGRKALATATAPKTLTSN